MRKGGARQRYEEFLSYARRSSPNSYKELEGYEEKPPKYRILESGVKVIVFVPYRGTFTIDFHTEMIKDKRIRDRLTKIAFHQPIAELKNLCSMHNDDGNVCMNIPVPIYKYFIEFINGDIQGAYQFTTSAALAQVLVSVKSLLVDYLLKMSNEEDIDFNTFVKSNPTMATNININAGVVNTGNGVVNAQNSTNIIGNNNSVDKNSKDELLRILSEIDKIASSFQNEEYEEVSRDIKKELEKDSPATKYIKRCFQSIPSILSGIGTSVFANGITPLVKDAVALLL